MKEKCILSCVTKLHDSHSITPCQPVDENFITHINSSLIFVLHHQLCVRRSLLCVPSSQSERIWRHHGKLKITRSIHHLLPLYISVSLLYSIHHASPSTWTTPPIVSTGPESEVLWVLASLKRRKYIREMHFVPCHQNITLTFHFTNPNQQMKM